MTFTPDIFYIGCTPGVVGSDDNKVTSSLNTMNEIKCWVFS